MNEWWEPGEDGKQRLVTSVSDDRYKLVGIPEGGGAVSPGASPYREAASTLGDELELATQGRAKVFGVSFKDRAAILSLRARDQKAHSGPTTTRVPSSPLPTGCPTCRHGRRLSMQATSVLRLGELPGVPTGNFYEEVGQKPAAVQYMINFAKGLVKNEHLGQNNVTDMLTVSISNTDILGHKVGPDSPRQREMIDSVDVSLNDFFTFLDKQVGLQNVVVALSGDHRSGSNHERGKRRSDALHGSKKRPVLEGDRGTA